MSGIEYQTESNIQIWKSNIDNQTKSNIQILTGRNDTRRRIDAVLHNSG